MQAQWAVLFGFVVGKTLRDCPAGHGECEREGKCDVFHGYQRALVRADNQ